MFAGARDLDWKLGARARVHHPRFSAGSNARGRLVSGAKAASADIENRDIADGRFLSSEMMRQRVLSRADVASNSSGGEL